jgi:hypothetical protein
MADKRDKLIKQFMSKKPSGDPFGGIGNLSPGQRSSAGAAGRITEDDPRWNPRRWATVAGADARA